ncbi:MAG TPA: TIGR03435 family protein [Bryobacteraceae bacterium]|jgi:uncharacterized protein (TIGR03435 family)|nr:TIGR03435 family protein [Bryobacteraceae bacterium]
MHCPQPSYKSILLASVLAFMVVPEAGTAQTTPLTFEVADLKVNNTAAAQPRVTLSTGRFVASNVPLRPLIAEAWTITPDGVLGPAWLDDVHVDIAAKAASPDTTDADVRLMVRSLLEDRMKLISHTEDREQRVLALSIWKGKPKLTPSDAPRTAEEGDCSVGSGTTGVRAVCTHMTMTRFAHELPEIAPRYVDRRVVDQTNLRGTWDFIVEFAPLAEAETGGGLSLFAALQAQLGLELKAKKLPVPVLAIDSMQKTPSPN